MEGWARVGIPCSDERAGEKETEAMCVLHVLEIILSEQREGNFEMHTGKIAQGLCIFVFYPEEGSTPHLLCCFLDFCRTQKAGPDKAETSVCERVTT